MTQDATSNVLMQSGTSRKMISGSGIHSRENISRIKSAKVSKPSLRQQEPMQK